MSDVLKKICDDKWEHIRFQKQRVSEQSLLEAAKAVDAPRGFHAALNTKVAKKQVGLIAEVKKASPSKGVIRADFDPEMIASAYEAGGAACLSVLTDMPYFQGKDEYLTKVRRTVELPVLRKDFMLDTYQVAEARALGADCILLIMAALSDTQAAELEAAALDFGMDVLVEVHDSQECERALRLRSQLLGVNNRNLKTLAVDLATTEQIAAMVPQGYTLVCESGIATQKDIQRMQKVGAYCFLVGESLMREEDIEAATRRLVEG